MNIVVAGCGKIGKAVVATLCAEGHDVTVIDKDTETVNEITNIYDVIGVCGNSADCETLEEANIADAELFVCVTGSDEMNMLSCFIAKKMGASHTVARIRNPEYNDQSLGFLRQQLNLSIAINPELLVAEEISNILQLPSAIKIERFSRRNIEMVEFILPQDTALDGMTMIKMRERYKANYLICAVQRNNTVYIPDGRFELKAGDRIAQLLVQPVVLTPFEVVDTLEKTERGNNGFGSTGV